MNIERMKVMKAIEFIESLQGKPKSDNLSEMPASEYFETTAGKKIIYFLSEKVRVIDEKTFELVDFYVTSDLKKNPLYKGRNLFSDMKALGFTYECTSHHQDEAPIHTYLFKAK